MKHLYRLLAVCFLLAALHSPLACQAQEPVMMSVTEMLSGFGIDTAMVNDTSVAAAYLDSLPQDYVALKSYCSMVRDQVQSTVSTIESYPHRDGLIWIDETTAIPDYDVYEYRLRGLADFMGRRYSYYSRLEEERIEREREEARQRALEEARLRQEALDREADALRALIELHSNDIKNTCDGVGISDKGKLKDLRDLYYSCLMVYNKYELSSRHATEELIAQLHELESFQSDVLSNVLGENSMPAQIEDFKNLLKSRCEKDNYDIFRSYSRVFKTTSVSPQFKDLAGYGEYIEKLRTIMKVQESYLHTIDLRATIANNSDAIIQLYGKKYRQVGNSYKDVLRTVNQLPTYTEYDASQAFINNLNEFIAAQQLYMDYYQQLEDITQRSDSILRICEGRFKDVASAYRDIQEPLLPIPAFKNAAGAASFNQQVRNAIEVQQGYIEVVRLRDVISHNDDTINDNRKIDRTVYSGYKLFRKQIDLTPNFSTVERSRSFISLLNSHVTMQQVCIATIEKRRTIEAQDDQIEQSTSELRNIRKAYSRMLKVYDDFGDITNQEDLRRYSRMCDYTIEMQEAFLRIIASDNVGEIDNSLYRESDTEKIKGIVGL